MFFVQLYVLEGNDTTVNEHYTLLIIDQLGDSLRHQYCATII